MLDQYVLFGPISRYSTIQLAVVRLGKSSLYCTPSTSPDPCVLHLKFVLLYLRLFIPNGSYSNHASCKE